MEPSYIPKSSPHTRFPNPWRPDSPITCLELISDQEEIACPLLPPSANKLPFIFNSLKCPTGTSWFYFFNKLDLSPNQSKRNKIKGNQEWVMVLVIISRNFSKKRYDLYLVICDKFSVLRCSEQNFALKNKSKSGLTPMKERFLGGKKKESKTFLVIHSPQKIK